MANNQKLQTNSHIPEDWHGGYKLELNITSESKVDNWTLDFELPYNISAAYGVDLVRNSNGSYTITGQDGWSNLNEGQSITPIFIIEDNGGQALPLQFINSTSNTESDAKNLSINDTITPSVEDKVIAIESGSKTISVDNDFGGNLENAIAAANDGEVVQLGNRTYYTSGIRIDKDITINGQDGSVVNGGGTSGAIFNLTSSASGATIHNIEITNGNNGIYGHGASNLTLQNLEIHNIGKTQKIAEGQNNTAIILGYATGLKLLDSNIYNVGRKGVSVGDTNGATISGLNVQDINLQAQHSQSHDAAGIKFFNTNNVILKDSYFANINANYIWNDTTNRTTIENNVVENVGSDFLKPSFNHNVDISGIYNEKSSNSIVINNYSSAVSDFAAYNATEFTTETMTMANNDFSSIELGTRDYWVNESAEKLIAITEDPSQADFSLFADEYFAQLNIN